MSSVYGDNKEELPFKMPPPKGKPFRTTTYADANLMHCLVTGRSMSGIIHMVNQTPIQWFCKKQNVVETATYGSEFMVARQATEQIMDLRYTLRMMGIPIDGPSWLFGDNQSVIISSNIPHSSLNKRHNALSYHRVREAIAAEILYFLHMDGKYNPSDILTKFLNWAKFWPLVQPLLFRKGETTKDSKAASPVTQLIEEIKTASLPSGSRGVTSGNSKVSTQDAIVVDPSGNVTVLSHQMSVSPHPKMCPNGQELSSGELQKDQVAIPAVPIMNKIFKINKLSQRISLTTNIRNLEKNSGNREKNSITRFLEKIPGTTENPGTSRNITVTNENTGTYNDPRLNESLKTNMSHTGYTVENILEPSTNSTESNYSITNNGSIITTDPVLRKQNENSHLSTDNDVKSSWILIKSKKSIP
jgi:hypothetical protein